MSDAFDLSRLLESWPYDPDNDARVTRVGDGREVLQVRTPLGVEQLELEGRPDGARPHGAESALQFHLRRLAKAKAAGRETDFALDAGDCAELFGEGTLYYFRYLRLFQLKRWTDTVRDTGRNLQMFDLVHQYAAREEDQTYLEKWRPYIVRMNAAASALLNLEKGAHGRAVEIINRAIERIEALDETGDETFAFERARSLGSLRELAAQIQQTQPISAMERLERQLRRAIDRQEFERAAELRDRIRELKSRQPAT
jgi:hypothetical protein